MSSRAMFYKMTLGLGAALLLAVGTAAADDDVKFTCEITGSSNDGFTLSAINPGSNERKCQASCAVTKKDGSTQKWDYHGTLRVRSGPQYLGGEAGIAGAPLKDPKVSGESCEKPAEKP